MDYDKLEAFVEKAKAGDKNALVELYKGMYNRVYFYAFKMFGNENDAADVVEEVFVKVFTRIDTLEDSKAFPKWLYMITVNECNQKIRADRKVVLIEESEELFEKLVTADDDLSLGVERKDIKSFLMSIIDLLPEEQKRAILLYYYEELTVAQIAEIEGVPEGTIKTRLSLARKKLKKACDSEERRTGVKLYSFGAPALSAVLTQASLCSPMPLDMAVGALIGALAAVGYIGAESARFITTNETEDKGFFSKMKQGIIIEVKPYKLVVLIAVIAVLIAGTVLVFSPKKANTETIPLTYNDNNTFEMCLSDLPESVKENAEYYSFGWYDQRLDDISPEMAYMRLVGGEDMYFDAGNYISVEEEMFGDWFPGSTGIIGFFDAEKNLISYAFGISEPDQDDIDINYVHKFKPLDTAVMLEHVDSVLQDQLDSAVMLDTSAFHFKKNDSYDIEILDIDFESEAFKSSGLEKSDIACYIKLWLDTDEEEALMQTIKSFSSLYWKDDTHLTGISSYNADGLGLGVAADGYYFGDYDNCKIHVIVLFNSDGNITAYSYMNKDQIEFR